MSVTDTIATNALTYEFTHEAKSGSINYDISKKFGGVKVPPNTESETGHFVPLLSGKMYIWFSASNDTSGSSYSRANVNIYKNNSQTPVTTLKTDGRGVDFEVTAFCDYTIKVNNTNTFALQTSGTLAANIIPKSDAFLI